MKTIGLEVPEPFSESFFSLPCFCKLLGLFSEPLAYGNHLTAAVDPSSLQFLRGASLGLVYHIGSDFQLALSHREVASTLIRQACEVGDAYKI